MKRIIPLLYAYIWHFENIKKPSKRAFKKTLREKEQIKTCSECRRVSLASVDKIGGVPIIKMSHTLCMLIV